MNTPKGNMKGFIFTLDAIFALVVASVGVSILLYVNFVGAVAYTSSVSQALGILQSMLKTTPGSIAGGSLYASYLSTSSNGSTYTWPQFGHDAALSSSTGYSLQQPYLLYTWNAPSPAVILPVVSINTGFVALAAGSKIYLLNATTGKSKTSFPSGSPSNVVGAPAVYGSMFFYGNATNTVRGVNVYNTMVQWNFTATNSITTPIEIENNYVAFGTKNAVYFLNPSNGSIAAYINLGVQAQVPAYVDGEYLVSTTSQTVQNYLYSYVPVIGSNVPASVWNVPLAAAQTTAPSSINNTIAVGSGNYLYIVSPGGNVIYESGDLFSRIVGIGGYGSEYYVETVNKLYSFSLTGNQLSTLSTISDSQNSTPSAGPGVAYTMINGNSLIAYNTSLNGLMWNVTLPSNYLNTGYSQVALAYGNIYVTNGNTLYVFGTYKPQPGDSLLQTLATMYLTRQGDYSNILLQGLYNTSTTGIFINNTYAPTLGIATFNSAANSYVEQASGFGWSDNVLQRLTFSVWIYPTASNGVIVDQLGQPELGVGWHYSMLEMVNGNVMASVPKLPCISIGTVPLNSWSNIVLTWNDLNYDGYINGALGNSGVGSASVPVSNTVMYYPIGDGEALANSCGSGAYFSGGMLNYQIYNTSLSPQQVMQLYQGGALAIPNTTYLSLWLPLDGNSNEFSGASNLGVPYSMKYTAVPYVPRRFANSYQVSRAGTVLYLNVNGTIRSYNVSVVNWR